MQKLGHAVGACFFRNCQVHSLGSQQNEAAEVKHTGSPVIFAIFDLLTSVKDKSSFTYFVETLWVTSVFMKFWMHLLTYDYSLKGGFIFRFGAFINLQKLVLSCRSWLSSLL